MLDALALVGVYTLGIGIACLAAGGRLRRTVAVLLAVAALGAPSLLPIHLALMRALLVIGCVLLLMRTIDLARARQAMPVRRRVWHVVALFDTRRAHRAPPSVAPATVRRLVGYALLAAAALTIARGVQPVGAWQIVRWLGGAVFCYSIVDSFVALLELLNRSLGVVPPPMHARPILSRSLLEFWSQRWNLIISSWLRSNCFLPLARRRLPIIGVGAAFGVSVLLHGYFTWVAVGRSMALLMGAFFAVQVPLVVVERALGVARWPSVWARTWTLGLLLVTSPLFVEPMLRILDPRVNRF